MDVYASAIGFRLLRNVVPAHAVVAHAHGVPQLGDGHMVVAFGGQEGLQRALQQGRSLQEVALVHLHDAQVPEVLHGTGAYRVRWQESSFAHTIAYIPLTV